MSDTSNAALAVLDNFGGSVPACSPDLDNPQIWRLDRSGEWVEYPTDEGDIYQAIFRFSNRYAFGKARPVGSAFVCRTIGWGASLDEHGEVGDIPPSERPDRFRIALDICATPSGSVASRLSFLSGEKAGEVIDDCGDAIGSLAEAVDFCALRVWGRDYTTALLQDYQESHDTKTPEQVKHLAHRVARFLELLDDESEGE